MDGISSLRVCGLVTSDTGVVAITVNHEADNNIRNEFKLTVWSK